MAKRTKKDRGEKVVVKQGEGRQAVVTKRDGPETVVLRDVGSGSGAKFGGLYFNKWWKYIAAEPTPGSAALAAQALRSWTHHRWAPPGTRAFPICCAPAQYTTPSTGGIDGALATTDRFERKSLGEAKLQLEMRDLKDRMSAIYEYADVFGPGPSGPTVLTDVPLPEHGFFNPLVRTPQSDVEALRGELEARLRKSEGELEQLRRENALLRAQVLEWRTEVAERFAGLEQATAQAVWRADPLEVEEAKETIREVTRRVFAGEPTFRPDRDVENPSDRYYVVDVKVRGEIDSLSEKEETWHVALAELSAGVRHCFRLSLDIVE